VSRPLGGVPSGSVDCSRVDRQCHSAAGPGATGAGLRGSVGLGEARRDPPPRAISIRRGPEEHETVAGTELESLELADPSHRAVAEVEGRIEARDLFYESRDELGTVRRTCSSIRLLLQTSWRRWRTRLEPASLRLQPPGNEGIRRAEARIPLLSHSSQRGRLTMTAAAAPCLASRRWPPSTSIRTSSSGRSP
jgi:hypothetical protein